MGRRGKRIDPQDIVGQCLGKFEVISYNGYKRVNTQGGVRVRHWYICIRNNHTVVIQRGQILRGR